MGTISIVSGIIIIKDIESFQNAIAEMAPDESYPWIRPEMFNLGSIERPYFYENPVVSFAATYKGLEGGVSWSEFILKFENVLEKLRFDFARIRLETEFMGDFEFFWGQKTGVDREFYQRDDLIECEKWFFGYGFRHMFGGLIHENIPDLPMDFVYPIEFDERIKNGFNEMIPELNRIPLNEKQYFPNIRDHKVLGNDNSDLILTYLKLHKIIDYGWETGSRFFIKRLREIKPISTPYKN